VAWNQKLDSGGVVVGDDVNVTLDVEMIIPPQASNFKFDKKSRAANLPPVVSWGSPERK